MNSGVEHVGGAEALLLAVENAHTSWDDLASAEAMIFGLPEVALQFIRIVCRAA